MDKEKITGGIVGIWAKTSTDSIPRNKLFEKANPREGRGLGILILL